VIWLVLSVAVGGAVVGWLVAHLVHRYHEDSATETAVLAEAACPSCAHRLSLGDTVPTRLWLSGARCPSCDQRLPWSWVAIQVAIPVLGLAMVATWGASWALIPFLWLVPVLVAAAAVDIRLMLIPRRIVWVGFGVGLLLIAAVSLTVGSAEDLRRALVGAGLYFAFLFVTHLISPGGMGFGDVRLATVLGLYLGWISIVMTAVGLFLACLFGVAIGLVVRRVTRGQRHFPFGPGLAAGTMVAIWFWSPILERVTGAAP
jgi:leader peptidase (prepilin peptidase)/N-methyltransferase